MSSPRNSAQAIAWARNQIVNPSQNWYRLCQTFVHDCFGIGGGAPTAYDAWLNSSHKHSVSSGSQIPAGVPVFWSGGSAGHTAISIGGGNCISTDIKRVGKPDVASIDGITSSWNKTLLGWTEDDNGVYIGKGIATDGTNSSSTNNLPGGSGSYPTGVDGTASNSSGVLTNPFGWQPQPDVTSYLLSGPRALMNDTPLLQSVSMLCQASMRSFMAAPNGDFIAWFPDYFGVYGTAAKMTIRDIELAEDGFTMMWDDERLVTHQFTAGSQPGYVSQTSTPTMGAAAVDIAQMMVTAGIATVEFPELMQALFNIDPNDPRSKNFLNPDAILQRFGARVDFQPMGQISGPEAEFWYACQLFQQNWAAQFSSVVHLTFMPEIWPGMLLNIDTFGFQGYVEQVVHSFSFADGGGFTTEVSIIAPSATKGGLYALPRAFQTAPSRKASSKMSTKKPSKKASR